jgi:hypothetical protein
MFTPAMCTADARKAVEELEIQLEVLALEEKFNVMHEKNFEAFVTDPRASTKVLLYFNIDEVSSHNAIAFVARMVGSNKEAYKYK